MFKVQNKNTRTKTIHTQPNLCKAESWCFYYEFWTYFTPSFSVSIVDFEQGNVCFCANFDYDKQLPGKKFRFTKNYQTLILQTQPAFTCLKSTLKPLKSNVLNLFKVHNKDTKTTSNASIKCLVNFEQISYIVLVFPLLNLIK